MNTKVKATTSALLEEYGGCSGTVYDDGTLSIVSFPDSIVVVDFAPDEWEYFETTNDPPEPQGPSDA